MFCINIIKQVLAIYKLLAHPPDARNLKWLEAELRSHTETPASLLKTRCDSPTLEGIWSPNCWKSAACNTLDPEFDSFKTTTRLCGCRLVIYEPQLAWWTGRTTPEASAHQLFRPCKGHYDRGPHGKQSVFDAFTSETYILVFYCQIKVWCSKSSSAQMI